MRNKPSTQIQRTQNNESPMSLTVLGPRGCKNDGSPSKKEAYCRENFNPIPLEFRPFLLVAKEQTHPNNLNATHSSKTP